MAEDQRPVTGGIEYSVSEARWRLKKDREPEGSERDRMIGRLTRVLANNPDHASDIGGVYSWIDSLSLESAKRVLSDDHLTEAMPKGNLFEVDPADGAQWLGISEEEFAHSQRRIRRASEISEELAKRIKADGTAPLPDLTMIVVSNDLAAAEEAIEAVVRGEMDFDRASVVLGSYARMEGMLRLQKEGYASRDHLLELWADTWTDSDPDDSSPALVEVWRELAARQGGVYAPDGPVPGTGMLRLYRGQREADVLGCQWWLDRPLAAKYARGAWFRTAIADGVVLEVEVPMTMPLAYLAQRRVVILDPAALAASGTEILSTNPSTGTIPGLRFHGLYGDVAG